MCAAALIDNGLSDVAGPHGRVSFHSQFFAVVRASVMRIDCVLFPYCPRVSGLSSFRRKACQIRVRRSLCRSVHYGRRDQTAPRERTAVDRKRSMLPTNSAEDPYFSPGNLRLKYGICPVLKFGTDTSASTTKFLSDFEVDLLVIRGTREKGAEAA